MLALKDFTEQVQDGRIFTVCFIKRTTGEERVMNCRTGVEKGTKGQSLSFEPADKNLLLVYDVQKKGHRMVNLDDLLWLKMHGQEYIWDQGSFKPKEGTSV